MIVRRTVASNGGPFVSPGGVCVSPGGVGVSPGAAPGLETSPARAEPERTHASAIANAKRFIIYSPLGVESYKAIFCSEHDRIPT